MQTATKTSRSITPAALTLGAVALFFLSFLMSGNANVLPQLFYQRFYPEQKVLLLRSRCSFRPRVRSRGCWHRARGGSDGIRCSWRSP